MSLEMKIIIGLIAWNVALSIMVALDNFCIKQIVVILKDLVKRR
jgi:hypothetical protein